MKLDNLAVTNWLSHRGEHRWHFAPLTLFSGLNHTGKTSIADAVAFVVMADIRRAASRGERHTLISDGAERGQVALTCQDKTNPSRAVTVSRNIADGKMIAADALPLGDAVRDAVPYVLDPPRFAQDKPDDRRRILRQTMRAEIGPAAIFAILRERGHPPAILEQIDPANSIDDWIAYCDKRASEARGAWKATTGENYGSDKAEGFFVPAPKPLEDEVYADLTAENALQRITELETAATEQQTRISQLNRTIGALDATNTANAREAIYQATLKATAAAVPKNTDELAAAELALADLSAQRVSAVVLVESLKARSEEPSLSCPDCGSLLHLVDGVLAQHKPPENPSTRDEREAAAHAVHTLDAALRTASRNRSFHFANLEASKKAEQELADRAGRLKGDDGEPPPDRASIAAGLDDANLRLATLRGTLNRVRGYTAALARSAEATKNAAVYHDQVKAWLAVKAALAPDGIPGEVLARVLDPFNAYLARMAGESGWKPVTIDAAMTIRIGGRPYHLNSESEQWRANAMLAIAIAVCADLNFVILDGFDVLDVPSRTQALEWLRNLTREIGGNEPEMDTVIVLATTKTPIHAPKDVAVHWLGPAPQAKAA